MSRRYMTKSEHNAIIAGLRCLQDCLPPNDWMHELLTDGDVEPITVDQLDQLIEDINFDEVQLQIEEGE